MIDTVLRVFLADPHRATRETLCDGLKQYHDIRIIGEGGSDERIVFLITQLQPDVVLINNAFKRAGGVSLTTRISMVVPQTYILILAAPSMGRDCAAAILAGAHGVCRNTAPPATVAAAIRAVAHGDTWIDIDFPLSPHIQRTLRITAVERQMLKAVSRGETNYEIARTLGLSQQTIKNKLSLLYRKLQVSNRTEAVRRALQLDLIS